MTIQGLCIQSEAEVLQLLHMCSLEPLQAAWVPPRECHSLDPVKPSWLFQHPWGHGTEGC